jgi:hypothetical protein
MKCKELVRNTVLLIFTIITNHSFAQDPIIKKMQATVFKEIKRPQFDSNKIWITGGRFDLESRPGKSKQLGCGGDNFSFSINSYLGLFDFYKKENTVGTIHLI